MTIRHTIKKKFRRLNEGCYYLDRTYILWDTATTLMAVLSIDDGDTLCASPRFLAGAKKFTLTRQTPQGAFYAYAGDTLNFCETGLKRVFKCIPTVLYLKRQAKKRKR